MSDMVDAGSLEHRLLGLIAALHGCLDLAELREEMLSALQCAVPCDFASLNDIGPDPGTTVVINRPPLAREWHDRFAALAHQNPLLARWLENRDGRAYRFSDVVSRRELEGLELFREVYRPLKVFHQIAFTLPSPPDRVLAIALSREQLDFSDHDRDFLNAARPFLIQCYRNALAVGSRAGTRVDASGLSALLCGEGLTRREAQVIIGVAYGGSNQAIADRLGISLRTCQKHLQHAFRTLGVRNRSDAAYRVWALAGTDGAEDRRAGPHP